MLFEGLAPALTPHADKERISDEGTVIGGHWYVCTVQSLALGEADNVIVLWGAGLSIWWRDINL